MMNIKEIINKQTEILYELNSLLDYEKDLLIKDKAGEIAELVEKKKKIARQIVEIEKIRIDLYKDKTAEDFAIEGIIDIKDVENLKKLIEKIKEKEETNFILTKQSLNYIRLVTMALNPNNKAVTYGSDGKIDDNSSSSLFTTKA